ncbi:hypothetical protein D910_06064 [Dendroctonus ponderosae]|uniref:Uncharacterized protein n=1 Tax=Dendroctonus ponderosae TaxID=77166 RepID=U4UFI6_DENPD|nr:hypothetical protein D910_06064 [Dendroctonus ponderosae]
MEKQENLKSQQYRNDEVIILSDSPSPTKFAISESSNSEEYALTTQEEPIDLTFGKSSNANNYCVAQPIETNGGNAKIIIQPKPPGSSSNTDVIDGIHGRGIKRNMSMRASQEFNNNWCPNTNKNQNKTYAVPNLQQPHKSNYSYAILRAAQPDASLNQFTTRQQEVLNMAKSIFSKRTRTLYHWMYPTASKQQIKDVVSNTWESMAGQEKNIYVAQVLDRFGYNNANLMVNPQLGQIKELPPMPGILELNSKASELQNAISSISNEANVLEVSHFS